VLSGLLFHINHTVGRKAGSLATLTGRWFVGNYDMSVCVELYRLSLLLSLTRQRIARPDERAERNGGVSAKHRNRLLLAAGSRCISSTSSLCEMINLSNRADGLLYELNIRSCSIINNRTSCSGDRKKVFNHSLSAWGELRVKFKKNCLTLFSSIT